MAKKSQRASPDQPSRMIGPGELRPAVLPQTGAEKTECDFPVRLSVTQIVLRSVLSWPVARTVARKRLSGVRRPDEAAIRTRPPGSNLT
jgi:hypothetical protein